MPSVDGFKRRSVLVLLFVLLFAILFLVVPVLAYSVIQLEGPRIQREAQDELTAIGQLKADQIEAWLAERRRDAETLMDRQASNPRD